MSNCPACQAATSAPCNAWREAQEHRAREVRLRVRMDAVLEKISLVGMQGLNEEERSILKEASDMLRHSRK